MDFVPCPPNHALTCMVTVRRRHSRRRRAITAHRGWQCHVGVRLEIIPGDDVAMTTVVGQLVRAGNFRPRTCDLMVVRSG